MRCAENTQNQEKKIAIIPACAVGLGNGCAEEKYRVDQDRGKEQEGKNAKEAATPSVGWSYHSSSITQNALGFHTARFGVSNSGESALSRDRGSGFLDGARFFRLSREPIAEYLHKCADIERCIVHIRRASEIEVIVPG